MLNIEMEFKSGILWVRLSGKLYENTVNTFNEEVLPVILKHGIMYIVVNLDKMKLQGGVSYAIRSDDCKNQKGTRDDTGNFC